MYRLGDGIRCTPAELTARGIDVSDNLETETDFMKVEYITLRDNNDIIVTYKW